MTSTITTPLLAILITAVAFAATNLENLFILLGYYQHPHYPTKATAVGYVSASGLLIVASYGVSHVAHLAPNESIRYLGLLPLFLGVWEALKIFRTTSEEQPKFEPALQTVQEFQCAIAVGLVTMASGGDSLVVFATLFADTHFSVDLSILATALGMGILWAILAQWLVKNLWISQWLNRFQNALLPLLLATIGIFILLDTPTDLD